MGSISLPTMYSSVDSGMPNQSGSDSSIVLAMFLFSISLSIFSITAYFTP